MQDIKIVFFDIDGTLIDMEKKKISEKTLDALIRLQKNGIRICLATGRCPVCLPAFPGVEFDACLTFNGSYCFSGPETVYSRPIPPEDVQILLRNAAAMGRPVAIATKDRLEANGTDEDLTTYYGFSGFTPHIPEDFDDVADGEVYQVMLGCREAEYPALLKDTRGVKIAAWWDRAVDVIPMEGGKGSGIREILAYFGLEKDQAMAFGDGNNDIEMLQAVGTGVAMENASVQLKAVAADVCGHVANDGIYHYCLERGLI